MIKKYDMVKSSRDLNSSVPKGCKGTIVMVYPDFPNSYEVEFIDDLNETIDTLTVSLDDILKLE